MGLAARVIPTLLVRGDQLVKGKRFDSWRSVGHPEQAVKVHAQRGVDELILLDIGATPEGRGPNFKLIEKLTRHCFTPITVGGGVRSVEDVRDLLNAGADKVAVGMAFVDLPEMKKISETFGKQALVASIDFSRSSFADGEIVFGGRIRTAGGTPIPFWADVCAKFAGEILLTSIDREGTMDGYDWDMIRQVAQEVDVPVIAHGGCGTYEHMRYAFECGASAAAAGALFAFTDATPRLAAEYLAEKGVEVRLAS